MASFNFDSGGLLSLMGFRFNARFLGMIGLTRSGGLFLWVERQICVFPGIRIDNSFYFAYTLD